MPETIPPQKQGHSLLGGSGAERWFACPGSIRLCRELPPVPRSPYALEGSCAHHLAATCLTEGKDASDYLEVPMLLPPDPPEAEVEYTPGEEMVGHVQTYLDVVRGYLAEHRDNLLLIEQRYDYDWLAPDMWGTADAVVCSPKRLRVIDFKYGRGHYVDEQDNPQLLLYAVGAYRAFLLAHPKSKLSEVALIIIQPRVQGEAVRVDSISVEDLVLWVKHTLRPRVAATQDPRAPLRAGDWCHWCPARDAGCTAHLASLEAQVPAVAAARAGRELPAPEVLSKEELGIVIRAIPIIDAWITGVKAYATSLLEAGQIIPGAKLVPKRAMRHWTDEEEAVKDLKAMGIDPWASKLVTPAEAERRGKKQGVKPADLEHLIEKVSSGFNLVSEDDQRPAVQSSATAQAAIDFKDVPVGPAPVESGLDPLAGLFE